MEQEIIYKIIYTAASLLILFITSQLLIHRAKMTQQKLKIKESRYFTIKKIIRIFAFVILLVILIVIWGINVKNLWVSLTSILTLIAIAFFAIWSLIGNILAGIIIFFTSPFKVDDSIEILPDNIKGTVLAINSFYTLLSDDESHYINVPNSLFFQKYIKVHKKAIAARQNKK